MQNDTLPIKRADSLLSSRDHPADMVMSMQLGADDFIQKPFHFDVLIAKIQAVFRRVHQYGTEPALMKRWCGAVIDTETNTVSRKTVRSN